MNSSAKPESDLGKPDSTAEEAKPSGFSNWAPADKLTDENLSRLTQQYGLQSVGLRPKVTDYLHQMWERRFFALELSRAREESGNSESRLGKAWTLLNPLLNTAVYFVVFGYIFKGHRAIPNYLAFLVIGVFFFTYTQKSIQEGARSIVANMNLVRALHFPRALLPVAVAIEQLLALGPALIVSIAIVLITGEGVSWTWLLLPIAITLQTMFNLGVMFTLARLTEKIRDVSQLLPFLLRTWLYLSGVVFPLQSITKSAPGWAAFLLTFNPGAVFVEIARDCLLTSYSVPPIIWGYALFWATIGLATGFIYFYKAEERYGRG
jgi:teichoic acid transport system permease protein